MAISRSQLGKTTDKKLEQAQRVQDFMNFQVTQEIPDYFNELDQMLFYLALAGCAFKKIYFDNTLDRICSKFVPAEDFVISMENTDLETADRYTQIMKLTRNEIRKHQISGYYKDIPLSKAESNAGANSGDLVQQTLQRVEGMTPSMADKIHTVLEVHTNLDVGEDRDELAKIMGYRTTEKNRSPGYKQIKNIKKSIIKKVKKLLDKGDIDLF